LRLRNQHGRVGAAGAPAEPGAAAGDPPAIGRAPHDHPSVVAAVVVPVIAAAQASASRAFPAQAIARGAVIADQHFSRGTFNNGLTLSAYNNVTISGNISNSNGGTVTLNANIETASRSRQNRLGNRTGAACRQGRRLIFQPLPRRPSGRNRLELHSSKERRTANGLQECRKRSFNRRPRCSCRWSKLSLPMAIAT
jgi:hypothetical protein